MGPRKRETGNLPQTRLLLGNYPAAQTPVYSPQIQRNVLPVVTKTLVVPNSRVPAHVVDVRGSWLSHSFH